MLAGCAVKGAERDILESNMSNVYSGGYLDVSNNVVYFVDESYSLVALDLNTDEKQTIISGKYAYLNIVNDCIYCINVGDGNCICAIDVNSGTMEKICDLDAWDLYYNDGKLYFLVYGEHGGLYYIDVKSKDYAKIHKQVNSYNIHGEEIFFQTYNEMGESLLLKSDLSGNNIEVIFKDDGLQWFDLYNDNIYYSTDINICQYDLVTKKSKVLTSGYIQTSTLNLNNGNLYYYDSNLPYSNCKKLDLKTKQSQIISDEICNYPIIIQNKLFYYTSGKEHIYLMDIDGKYSRRLY